MDARSAAILEHLRGRHPEVNLQPWSLFKNRSGVRSLEEAVARVEARTGPDPVSVYGYTAAQWQCVGEIPDWSLPGFLSGGDARLLVPAAHLPDYWFYSLDSNVMATARRVVLDLLGHSLHLKPFLAALSRSMGPSYGDGDVRRFLLNAPQEDDLHEYAVACGQYGPAVGRLVAEGVPVEYAQEVAGQRQGR